MATTILHLPRVDQDGIDAFASHRGAYTNGGCGPFAMALHRVTGWPIVILDTCQDLYAHLGVQSPDGTVWDARGAHVTIESFIAGFATMLPKNGLRVCTVDDLMRDFSGLSLWDPIGLERLASEMFPDLPHQASSDRSRTLAFIDEVEALSRKLDAWIAPHSLSAMHTWPVIGEEFDKIVGYRAARIEGVVTIDRMLTSEQTRGPSHASRRSEKFLAELEALSRKYKLWLRAGLPTTWPRLCALDLDILPEAHYVLRQTDNYAGYLLGLA